MENDALRLLVVEDDPAQQQAMRRLLRGLGYTLVGIAGDADAAVALFRETAPDLVLLDISLAGSRDGIVVAEELTALRPVPLIFLTAYPDAPTFERARRVGPFAFLGKPYNGLLLGHAIELAMQHFAATQGLSEAALAHGAVLLEGVFVREDGRYVKVPLGELLVLEADDSYTHLHTVQRKYTVRTSLRELEEKLPPDRFIRIHRTYIVQLTQVRALDYRTGTVQVGSHTLPLSRSHRDEVIHRLEPLR